MSGQELSPEQDFLAQLDRTAPDVSGMAKVRLGDVSRRLPMARYRELAATRGWEVERTERSGSTLYVRIKRSGSAPVTRSSSEFLSGPGLAELRGNRDACEEAARVLQETGVAVLSEEVLDDTRRRHLALRRRVVRLGWLSALPCVFAFSGVLFSFVLWRDGGTQAGNVLMTLSAVAAVVFVATLPLPIRAERARKAAISDYTTAYERVVSAALNARSSPPE